jgi:hypothetical protein
VIYPINYFIKTADFAIYLSPTILEIRNRSNIQAKILRIGKCVLCTFPIQKLNNGIGHIVFLFPYSFPLLKSEELFSNCFSVAFYPTPWAVIVCDRIKLVFF